jgi:hypothetical protein
MTNAIDGVARVGLPSSNPREDFSQAVCDEQESMQGSLPSQELKDFIKRILVPILVDHYLEERTNDAERGVGWPNFLADFQRHWPTDAESP